MCWVPDYKLLPAQPTRGVRTRKSDKDDKGGQREEKDFAPPCDTINDSMLDIMPCAALMLLICATRRMSKLGRITLSTACSGTDLVGGCLLRLMYQISLYTGHYVNIDHVWSCESEGWKRVWIIMNTRVPTVFQDLFHLNEQRAINHDGNLEAIEWGGHCGILVVHRRVLLQIPQPAQPLEVDIPRLHRARLWDDRLHVCRSVCFLATTAPIVLHLGERRHDGETQHWRGA